MPAAEQSKGSSNLCSVCSQIEKKYTCPVCRIKYCSVACYKEHKETCKAEIKANEESKSPSKTQEAPFTLDKPETAADLVPDSRLQVLAESGGLAEQLNNRHLREVLTWLNTSPHPYRDFGLAMQEPLFTEFVQECMSSLDPSQQPAST